MKKILLITLVSLFSLGAFSQQKTDTLAPTFDSIFSQLKRINFEEIFSSEEFTKIKNELRLAANKGAYFIDSIMNDTIIQQQFKQDMQQMQKDMQDAFNSEEFKKAQAEMVKELETILEEFEAEE